MPLQGKKPIQKFEPYEKTSIKRFSSSTSILHEAIVFPAFTRAFCAKDQCQSPLNKKSIKSFLPSSSIYHEAKGFPAVGRGVLCQGSKGFRWRRELARPFTLGRNELTRGRTSTPRSPPAEHGKVSSILETFYASRPRAALQALIQQEPSSLSLGIIYLAAWPSTPRKESDGIERHDRVQLAHLFSKPIAQTRSSPANSPDLGRILLPHSDPSSSLDRKEMATCRCSFEAWHDQSYRLYVVFSLPSALSPLVPRFSPLPFSMLLPAPVTVGRDLTDMGWDR